MFVIGQYHLLRLDITMGMVFSYCFFCLIHYQERPISLYAKTKIAYDLGLLEIGNSACFITETFYILAHQLSMQNFDGSICTHKGMLTQIHICKASSTE